ncbi:cupin domain-containing protein [Clostridium lundense]|uniref:cupin domain-containing protein n=1 Tax=Clostridium lundense TaxID=319475 RepID=UPI000483B93C|nr:cupin domain-containing protein [Clostridium lundense]
MYNDYETYTCPYFMNTPMYNLYRAYPCPYCINTPIYNQGFPNQFTNDYIPFTDEMEYASRSDFLQSEENANLIPLKDYGPEPFAVNINEVTKQNTNYRTALWTGEHLQLTLMSINTGEDIGLEVHPNLDQFIRIEEGEGLVQMGDSKNNLNLQEKVYDDFAFIIPAGKWHNLINTGNKPIKLYSIYAPPQHPHSTVQETKAIAEATE